MIFHNIRTEQGVKLQRAKLLADAQGIDAAVQRCGALDEATRANWGLFYAGVVNVARAEIPFFGVDDAADSTATVQGQLFEWGKRLGPVCPLNMPLFDPSTPDTETAPTLQLARYATVAIVAIGGAYTIGKLVELLPKGRGR
jgi:hypothetical protein